MKPKTLLESRVDTIEKLVIELSMIAYPAIDTRTKNQLDRLLGELQYAEEIHNEAKERAAQLSPTP